jgi:hypothetical protein
MSVICDFSQPFQIVNIFCSRMADKNREMTDIFVSHFLWVIITLVTNSATLYIYVIRLSFLSETECKLCFLSEIECRICFKLETECIFLSSSDR